MNIHRAPFTGRNGEYYSEDGFLSGVIGSLGVPACTAVMSAFNRIGATWTGGNYVPLTSVLHNEWGFRGWIVTDSASSAGSYMDVSQKLEVVRWVATGVSVVGLGLIGFTAWRNHVKRRAERAEQE